MNASSRPSPRAAARAAALGLVLFGTTAAWATPTYPTVIRSELSLSSTPACEVCHQGNPAIGTVVTPFGTSMRARGLVLYNEASLRTALTALATNGVDSDGDGTPDTAELKAGQDPNVNESDPGGGGVGLPPEPTYGCGAGAGGPALGVLGMLGWGARRRRQTR